MQYSNQFTGFKRIFMAAANSWRALVWLLRNEAAFRQEMLLCTLLTAITFTLSITPLQHLALICVLLLVLFAEVVNTAIEAAIDRIGPEHHELSGLAKDLGSLAVTISLFIALITWATVLLS